ncbi:MAG: STAS domain-containing protein [Roseiflexus sp.]|nr:STAS domain-containing protein [Roseiflexus sp.]MCS7288671.1 STAS domain-containing protein [Roseiflexus sp.]MDW8233787.1 STAS domain-containing protein [Roseiflexaceae bacterium]
MTTDVMPESTLQAQMTRLRRFLSAYMPVAFLFGVVFLVLALIFRDPATGISGVAIIANGGVLLYALRSVQQGKVQAAVLATSVGLLAGGLIILLVQPFLFATPMLTPLLVVVLGLQYLTIQPLKRLIAASAGCSLIALSVGHLLPQGVMISNLPEWFKGALQIGGAGATAVFVMVLLWHFSALLNEMLSSLRTANRELEMQQVQLIRTNEQLQQQLASERELLNLVSALETPVVSLAEGVLLAPIVGHVDSRRADMLRARLLEAVHANRTRLMILDITGVATVDTSVAQALMMTIQALRLLGCRVVVSGISATVAMTLTHLGIDMSNIETVRSPEEALERLSRGDLPLRLPVLRNGNSTPGEL